MDSKQTIIESQADWLTVTCHHPDYIPSFRAWARRAVEWERSAGNKPRDVTLLGYVGLSCGHVRWGARADGDIVMLSGDVASKELSRALQYGDHVTRLDIAVTVRLDPPDPHVETSHYDAYITAPAREGRRAKATLILSDDGGATFYLGKRTSDVMLRVYNKAVESGEEHYEGCHRYELEVKGDRAGITATQLEGVYDSARFCQEAVYDWAARRGVTPYFPCVGGRQLVPGFRRRADVDTKLAWLENQVRPSIHWLTSQGKRPQTLTALDVNGTEVEDTGTGAHDLDTANWPNGG